MPRTRNEDKTAQAREEIAEVMHVNGPGLPRIDADALTRHLAGLPPLERIAAADIAGKNARALVGEIAELRRAAVAEAAAQGLDVPLSGTSVRDAVRPDREALQSALAVLARPGVSSAATRQLAQGLAPRAPLDAVARRVLIGVSHLTGNSLNPGEYEMIMGARDRAGQILGTSAPQ